VGVAASASRTHLLTAFTLLLTASCLCAAVPKPEQPPLGTIRTPLREFKGHQDEVSRIVFSPDGTLAASSSKDKTIRIWDVATGRELRSIRGHNRRLTDIAFSPDGRFIASGSLDALVKVWEVKTGEQFYELDGHNQRVTCLAWHPDGKRILTGCCDHLLRIWKLEDESVLLRIPNSDCVRRLVVSRDGALAAIITADGMVNVYEVATGRRTFQVQTSGPDLLSELPGLAMTSDSRRIIVGPSEAPMAVYDTTTGEKLKEFPTKGRLLAISPDDRYVSTDWSSSTQIYDLSTGKLLVAFQVRTTSMEAAAFSPDGKLLLTGGNPPPGASAPQRSPGPFLWDFAAAIAKQP
jgi:WD40 repeat protein